VTKQEIYEQIVQLTSELHATNVAEKIFNTAKEGDSAKVEEVFENFKKENREFYLRILNFGASVRENLFGKSIKLFGSRGNKVKETYVFDNNIINAVSFYALMILAEVDEYYLFDWGTKSSERFIEAISNAGYDRLACYVDNFSVYDYIGPSKQFQNIYECLVNAFKYEYEW